MKINKDSKHWILPPWDHQIEAINRALSVKPDGSQRTSFGFFLPIGVGKTKSAIETVRLLCALEKKQLRILVLGPPIVQRNWADEFRKNSRIELICLPAGTGKKRVDTMTKELFSPGGTKRGGVCVLGYPNLTMPAVYEKMVEWQPDVLVYDEVHMVSNSKSKRSKAAYKLSRIARYRYGLTGTPITNDHQSLFGIYKVLDLGETFGVSLTAFMRKYFYDKNAFMSREVHFPDWRLQESSEALINGKLEDTAMSVEKTEALKNLPPLIVSDIFVDLSDEQKRAYREMKKDLITFVEGKPDPATAQLAVTKSLRLQQIASGHIILESGDKHDFKETPRDKALEELLERITNSGEKVLVWSVFKQNYTSIKVVCERLGVKYVEVHGSVSSKKKFEHIEAFNNDPDIQVFIGHPRSVGVGINLVAAKYSVFYSRDFSFISDEQSEGRNYRGGSEKHDKIIRYNIIAAGTIDEKVSEALENKEKISSKLLMRIAHTF